MRETIILHKDEWDISTKLVDNTSWDISYLKGYREPRYPVPAHQYHVQFTRYSVAMELGVTKQWYPNFPEPFRGPYLDSELVQLWTDYPRDLFS